MEHVWVAYTYFFTNTYLLVFIRWVMMESRPIIGLLSMSRYGKDLDHLGIRISLRRVFQRSRKAKSDI